MDEILFIVGEENYAIEKKILTEKSPYFKAMFSGSYSDETKKSVTVDLFEPQSIESLVHFLQHNEVKVGDVYEMIDLLKCSTYFQIDALIQELETKLLDLINYDTWLQIMEVAQESNSKKLAQTAELYGLYEFEDMLDHICVIKSFERLAWYLEHPKLYVKHEWQVFTFGEVWIHAFEDQCNKSIIDIMKFLDFQNLTMRDLELIARSSSVAEKSKTFLDIIVYAKKLEDPYALLDDENLKRDFPYIYESPTKSQLIELLKRDTRKGPNFSPAMVLNKKEKGIDFIYRLNRQSAELEPWLKVGSGSCWGYSVSAWGAYRVVIACGEMGRGSGIFQRRVRVWDELRQQWDIHDIELPCRRHCAAVVHKDVLYLVGGIGSFRVVLASGLAYDLIKQSWTNLPSLLEEIQNPAICIHNNEVYVGSFTKVYVLREIWEPVVNLNYKPSFFCSYGDELYIARNFYNNVAKYSTLTKVLDSEFAVCSLNVTGMCNQGNNLFAFTEDSDFRLDGGLCHIERINLDKSVETKPETIWTSDADLMNFYSMPGCFSIISFNQCI